MKKIILVVVLFAVNIIYSQKFVNEKGYLIDFTNNEIELSVNENIFSGKFEYININFKKYIITHNNSKILILDYGSSYPSEYDKYFIENVIIINSNEFELVKKQILKNNSYVGKKMVIEYEGKNDKNKYLKPEGEYKLFWSEKFISEKQLNKQMEKEKELQKRINKYDSISNLKEIIGTYEIKIYQFEGVKLNSLTKGKLYITEEGFSLKAEINGDNTIRGSHLKDSYFTPETEGEFYFKDLNSFWDNHICIINLKSNSGAITSEKGKEYKTTTFTIVKKLE